jgi:hypothetical protein
MLPCNHFLIQGTGAEPFVKNLGHARKANEYTAADYPVAAINNSFDCTIFNKYS